MVQSYEEYGALVNIHCILLHVAPKCKTDQQKHAHQAGP